jgi:O-antigen ligase
VSTRVLPLPRRNLFPLAIIAFVAIIAAFGIVAEGPARTGVLIATAGVVIAAVLQPTLKNHLKEGYLHVEVPVILLLISGLTFRLRDAEALADNPLDAAAAFRILCVSAALGLALLSFATRSRVDVGERALMRSRPFRLYGLYVVVVFLGAPLSVLPLFTMYRGFELAAGWLVLAAARRTGGWGAVARIESTLYWFTVALVVSVWVGVVLFPSQALLDTDTFLLGASPLPWQLQGVIPAISSNGVGDIGATLALWSLGYRYSKSNSNRPGRRLSGWIAVLGFVTLIGAQYRTGYIGAAAGLLLLFALRKRKYLAVILVGGVLAAILWGSQIVSTAEPYVLRGQSADVATDLSGRLYWWNQALPVWRESPLLGNGLLTGTRFEVLEEIGFGETSTIHNTWLEALVGTGLVGTFFLAATVLIVLRRALWEALSTSGMLAPMLVLTMMVVRSVTGTTFETAGGGSLVLLMFAMLLNDARFQVARSPTLPPPDDLRARMAARSAP